MTRWPDREPVNDGSQGVPLATLQEFVRYWETEYDWRKVEARLNALPQFMTEIDGLDIHFIHVRPRHENAPIFPGEIYRAPRTWAERSSPPSSARRSAHCARSGQPHRARQSSSSSSCPTMVNSGRSDQPTLPPLMIRYDSSTLSW
ncbi:epoxide hydrolase N-terminal domain-containing protein [Micromonospora sp. NPDC023888]|uniref:epoxide hydrolase N-terminal domain-containing protein n=1 Tax=Micromonospora sp. NPDC023888 TaxID=3155607 RepID=UPI0033FD4823